MKYVAYSKETCPSTGREHFQGFVYFRNAQQSVRNVSRCIAAGTHVEPCRGSLRDNAVYCSKAGQLIEYGEAPKQGARMDIEDMFTAVKAGTSELELAEGNNVLWSMYRRALERYRFLLQPQAANKAKLLIILWGPSGSGKTRRVVEELIPAYGEEADFVAVQGEFILGYNNAPIVVFDDFAPGDIARSKFVRITDRYPLTVSVKHGSKRWNPEVIIFTSNYPPESWFPGDEAVARRFDEFATIEAL